LPVHYMICHLTHFRRSSYDISTNTDFNLFSTFHLICSFHICTFIYINKCCGHLLPIILCLLYVRASEIINTINTNFKLLEHFEQQQTTFVVILVFNAKNVWLFHSIRNTYEYCVYIFSNIIGIIILANP